MKLSIIVANYNYRDFVGAAIDSALAVNWPDKEVIVVDDASTDDSRTVIESFGDRITAYFRPKSHQLGAHSFGFQQSSGDIIIFLDSDDLLEPEVMREVAKVWRPGVSKVQFRMNLIDAAGIQLGSAIPQFLPHNDPTALRHVFLKTMAYTTPPGSGNAYSRDFARKAFALAPSTMWASDDPLLTLAPILGDVLTIRQPLARYRVHGKNDGAMDSLKMEKFRKRLHQDIDKANLFMAVARQQHLPVPHDPLRSSLNHLEYRLASYLVDSAAHPFPKDAASSLVYRLISSATRYSQMRFRERGILIAWAIACTLAPPPCRHHLIQWRFAAMARPAIIRRLLGTFSSLRSTHLPDRA